MHDEHDDPHTRPTDPAPAPSSLSAIPLSLPEAQAVELVTRAGEHVAIARILPELEPDAILWGSRIFLRAGDLYREGLAVVPFSVDLGEV